MNSNFSEEINYERMFENIKRHLSRRSRLLLKRTLLIAWPFLIYVAVFSILGSFNLNPKVVDIALVIMLVMSPIFIFYIFALSHIFFIEKVVWIDSYSDKKRIDEKKSFRIARKLFWASLRMRLQIFFRYYFIGIFLYLTILFITLYLIIAQDFRMNPWLFIVIFIVIGPMLVYVFHYYLKIKLRYIWFLFIDNYGSDNFSYGYLFKEMSKLNKINKSESFKKALVVDLGADIVQGVVQFSLSSIFHLGAGRFEKFSKEAEVATNVVSAYTQELTAQAASLSKLSANYVLYCYSVHKLYGRSQCINENVYSLRK